MPLHIEIFKYLTMYGPFPELAVTVKNGGGEYVEVIENSVVFIVTGLQEISVVRKMFYLCP